MPRGPQPQKRPSAARRAPPALRVAPRRCSPQPARRRALRRGVRARRRTDRRGQPGLRDDVRLHGQGGPRSHGLRHHRGREPRSPGRACPEREPGAVRAGRRHQERRGPPHGGLRPDDPVPGSDGAGGCDPRHHGPEARRGAGGRPGVPVRRRPDRRVGARPAPAANGGRGRSTAGDLRGRSRRVRRDDRGAHGARQHGPPRVDGGRRCRRRADARPARRHGLGHGAGLRDRRAVLRRRPVGRARPFQAGGGRNGRGLGAVAAGAPGRRAGRRAPGRLGSRPGPPVRPGGGGGGTVCRRGGRGDRAGRRARPARRAERAPGPPGGGPSPRGSGQVRLRLERLARAANAARVDPRIPRDPLNGRGRRSDRDPERVPRHHRYERPSAPVADRRPTHPLGPRERQARHAV